MKYLVKTYTNTLSIEETQRIYEEEITDSLGNRMPYRLTFNGNGLPLIIILHGHGSNSRSTFFNKSGWNVLAPLDKYGHNCNGSWWLGEHGDFFVRDLLQELIKNIKSACSSHHVFFYGSSMGGYGAILHGILSAATAVYANVPQTYLLGSGYHKVQLKNFDSISNTVHFIENDLSKIINTKHPDDVPLFFICDNRFSFDNYLGEQTFRFITACVNEKINFHLEVLPQKGHSKNHGINEVIELFKKYTEVDFNE